MIRFILAMLALPISASSLAAPVDFTAEVNAIKRTAPAFAEEFTTGLTPNLYDRGYSPWPQNIGNRLLVGNNERQIYVDAGYLGTETLATADKVNTGGTAIFMARRMDRWTAERVQKKIASEKPLKAYVDGVNKAGWMSAMIKSRQSFGPYGYIEFSMAWDGQAEGWPAAWMLPKQWTWPPEIDVVEMKVINGVPMAVMGIHSKDPAFPNKGCRVAIPNGGKGFHRYGFYWDKVQAVFFLDGKESCRMPTPSDLHQPFYPLLNLAVGGWGKEPTAASPAQLSMQVDYWRYWKANPNKVEKP